MGWLRPPRGRSSRVLRLAGLAVVITTAGIAGVFALTPFAARGVVAMLDLALDAAVWLTMSFKADDNVWTVLATIGRSAARLFMTRQALAAVGSLVLLSSLALYGLQRLLGAEEESSR